MASSASSGVSFDLKRRTRERGRGIPRKCRCGESSIVKTSNTLTNPCQLFHCCPFGSKEDNFHLFKWTDESMVEEMEIVEIVLDKIQKDVGTLEKGLRACESQIDNLECETRTCEAVVNSYGKDIEAVKGISHGWETEIEELKAKVTYCENEIQACH